jgi:hypothetical protein
MSRKNFYCSERRRACAPQGANRFGPMNRFDFENSLLVLVAQRKPCAATRTEPRGAAPR